MLVELSDIDLRRIASALRTIASQKDALLMPGTWRAESDILRERISNDARADRTLARYIETALR